MADKNFLNNYFSSKFFERRLEQLKTNIEELEKELEVEHTEEKMTRLETLKKAEHMLSRLANKSR